MSRSWLVRLLLALVLLLSVAGIAQAQDSDVTIGVWDVLESGVPVKGVFENGSTAYLYAFSGSAGDTVTVTMTQDQDSTLDPFVVLMGPHGEVIASDDDSGTDISLSSQISSVTLPDDGTYLVLATSFIYIDNILVENETENTTKQADNETYKLMVEGNTPADSNAEGSLLDITRVSLGASVNTESTLATPVTYFTYDGKAGDTVSFDTTDADVDTILHVFDPEGNRIAVNDDNPDGSGTTSAINNLTLPEDGTYLILAGDVFFYNAGVPDASLAFKGGKYTFEAK